MTRTVRNAILVGAALATISTMVPAGELADLEFRMVVDAPRTQVWNAWSTAEGLETFFGREAIIEPHAEGAFAIHFAPGNPPGQRGAEDLSIMAFEPERRIAFSWSAPPNWPAIRAQRTFVEITLTPAGEFETLVVLRQIGWGDGSEWGEVRDYFAGAWKVVLDRLQYSFREGPIDWDNPPEGLMYRFVDNNLQ